MKTSNIDLLPVEQLKDQLTQEFFVIIKEIEDNLAPKIACSATRNAFLDFISYPGKFSRPILFLSTYASLCPQKSINTSLIRFSLALEMFHNFSLIHDDIIDDSHSRRGKPTLHKQLEASAQISATKAGNISIILGDFLFGYTWQLLSQVEENPAHTLQAIRYFSQVSQDTGLGECMEIVHQHLPIEFCDEELVKRTNFLKTTRYTVEAPLTLAYILAGANPDEYQWVYAFAQPLGLAFQIENDLHEIRALLQGEDTLAYDIIQGVRTLYLVRLYHKADNQEKENISQQFQALANNERIDPTQLKSTFCDAQLLQELEQYIHQLFTETRKQINQITDNSTMQNILHKLINYFEGSNYHSEASVLAP